MERVRKRRPCWLGRLIPRDGLTRRWFRNAFFLIAMFLLVLLVLFCLMLRYYYYESVESALDSRAALYQRTLELSAGDNVPWGQRSRELIAYFTDKDKMELQVLDAGGHILLSSTGFVPPGSESTPDFGAAGADSEGRGVWRGHNSAGESVMALTLLEKDDTGTAVGALRYVVSLAPINRQIWLLSLLLFGLILLILVFVLLSGSYFINSIVVPVTDIGRTARRIAMGEYDARLEKKYDDEIGELCDTINFMAGEISAAEQLKNDFISSVSHELRTPLTAIKGWCETLQAVPDDRELAEKGMTVIGNEARRLSGIVEELLDFSRMQGGHMSMHMELLDVLAELEEAVFLYRDKAARAKITLEYVESGYLPPVRGDSRRLKQVFINLLDNAVKYSRPGDRVRVEAAAVPAGVQVVVSDTGIGIDADQLPRIRQKFYQVDSGTAGAGIGLAMVDEIVRLHGGSLDIDSRPGEGTTVTIILPPDEERM